MLRKFSHIILITVLLVSTMGVAISKHYCSGSFVSASVFQEAKSCCGDSDCCHNEDQFYQVKDDFSAPQIITTPELAGFNLFIAELNPLFLNELNQENSVPFFVDYSPPPPPKIQTFLSLKQTYLL